MALTKIFSPDGVAADFGTDLDTTITQSGGTLNISDAGNSNPSSIFISSASNDGIIFANNRGIGNSYMAKFSQPNGCGLYHNTNLRIETTSLGASVTGVLGVSGTITGSGNLELGDSTAATNNRIRLGDGDDLQFYHASGHSYITNSTGDLKVYADNFIVNNADNSENKIRAVDDGAVDLYYNGIKTFSTNANGITVVAAEGGDAYVNLYADEGDDNDDIWRLVSSSTGNFHVQNASSGSYANSIVADGNGNVELYYNNALKFSTVSNGALIESATSEAKLTVKSTAQDGAPSIELISDNADDAADYWRLRADGGGTAFQIQHYANGSWEKGLECNEGGAVELYHNNTRRLLTTTEGAQTDGHHDIVDGNKFRCGNSQDLQIYHDAGSTESRVWHTNGTGWLNLRGDAIKIGSHTGTEDHVITSHNGSVKLFYDNVEKVKTDPKGIVVNSGGSGEGLVQIIANNGSSSTIEFGDGEDDDVSQIWYDHYGKSLNLRTSEDAEINFFENGTKVLQTCSEGIRVMDHKIYLDGGSDGCIMKGAMSVSASAGWVTIFTIPTTCQVMLFTTASHNAGFSSACWDISHSNSGGNSTEEEHKNNAYSPSSINVRIDGNNVQVDVSYDIWGSFVGIVTYGAGGIGNIT